MGLNFNMTLNIMPVRALFVLFLAASAFAHTWVEQMRVIASNGTFIGAPGYARGNYLRTASGFNDGKMTYLVPPGSRSNVSQILPSDKLCKDTQQNQFQAQGSPRLQASPGDPIALRYQENGHVTLPNTQPGKPKNRGTVYVYGTTQPKVGEKLLDVHKQWNEQGTGGDKRGVLLSVGNFDDGRCYQINGGNISTERQKEYPHTANQLMGADLWCQQDIRLPTNAPSGKPYTLYWVWDWPTAPGADPTYPHGKAEIYTTCMDVDVVKAAPARVASQFSYATDQDLNNAAIPSQFAALASSKPTQSAAEGAAKSTSIVYATMTSVVGGQAKGQSTTTAYTTMQTMAGC